MNFDVRGQGRPQRVDIHIGEMHASREPAEIHTLLGSCVSACLFDPGARIGGMNHILLPGKAELRSFDQAARFGINAMELLINRLLGLGASRKAIQAKVFGGGHVIPGIDESYSPGPRNAAFVLEFLVMEGILIANQDVGGYHARRIYFRTDTGEVWVKRIRPLEKFRVALTEKRYTRKVGKLVGKEGEIFLFSQGKKGK